MPTDQVRVLYTKWPDRPHWQLTVRRLGEDAYGVWRGGAVGTVLSRPGSSFGDEVTMVDLDLDVIALRDGTVFVDDEDEFADHQRRFGYPDTIVSLAQESCAVVLDMVRSSQEPFGHVGHDWLDHFVHGRPPPPY